MENNLAEQGQEKTSPTLMPRRQRNTAKIPNRLQADIP